MHHHTSSMSLENSLLYPVPLDQLVFIRIMTERVVFFRNTFQNWISHKNRIKHEQNPSMSTNSERRINWACCVVETRSAYHYHHPSLGESEKTHETYLSSPSERPIPNDKTVGVELSCSSDNYQNMLHLTHKKCVNFRTFPRKKNTKHKTDPITLTKNNNYDHIMFSHFCRTQRGMSQYKFFFVNNKICLAFLTILLLPSRVSRMEMCLYTLYLNESTQSPTKICAWNKNSLKTCKSFK